MVSSWDNPELGWLQFVVHPDRRRRGHGTAIAHAAFEICGEAAEPELRVIDTWNAEPNDPMVGISERLGYRAMGRNLEFQRRI